MVSVGSGIFQCNDAAHTAISCSRVNDDYCDCLNGRDEPGTSACSAHGVRFACADGAQSVPTSFVDDGFVDCPDGSDEQQ